MFCTFQCIQLSNKCKTCFPKLIRQLQSVTLVYEPQSLCGKPYIAYLCKFMQRTRRTATTTSGTWLSVRAGCAIQNRLLIQLSRLLFWSYIIMHIWWRKNSCKTVENNSGKTVGKQWENSGGGGSKVQHMPPYSAFAFAAHNSSCQQNTFLSGRERERESRARLEEQQTLRQPICLYAKQTHAHTHRHIHFKSWLTHADTWAYEKFAYVNFVYI